MFEQAPPSLWVALAAGFLTFFSPCILPIIPSYILYIAGVSLAGHNVHDRIRIIQNSVFFILGFSLVFVALGAAASVIGQFLAQYREVIRISGGILIIFLGLSILGIIRMDFLMKERRLQVKAKPASILGSFLVGVTFAAAWTPCVGPILGAILVMASAANTVKEGMVYLAVYSFGLAIPFFITSYLLGLGAVNFKGYQKYGVWVERISAVFLIGVGLMVVTNTLRLIGIVW